MNNTSSFSNSSKERWLSRNVFFLGLVSFFADLSGEMMTPILPLFIAALGGSSFIIGLIGGLGDAVANIVKVGAGYLADKFRRRKYLIMFGYGIPFFAKLGIGLSTSWEEIVLLKPTERLGKGIRGAPRDSLLADSSPFAVRGKVFGFHRMMDTAGAILGSLIALIIVLLFAASITTEIALLRLILVISAVISLLAVVPLIFVVEPSENEQSLSPPRQSLMQNLKSMPRVYYKFLFISLLFGLANFTILLIILHAKNVLLITSTGLDHLVVTLGLFIWFNIVYTGLSIPFGSWSDTYGRKGIFAIGMGLFIMTCMLFGISTDPLILILSFGVYGAFHAATDGISKAFTVDLLPTHLKGTGIGLLQTVTGFAAMLGGGIAGFLYDIDFRFPFAVAAGLGLIALILLLRTDFTRIEDQ